MVLHNFSQFLAVYKLTIDFQVSQVLVNQEHTMEYISISFPKKPLPCKTYQETITGNLYKDLSSLLCCHTNVGNTCENDELNNS